MLESDYTKRFKSLIQSVDWNIELPSTWSNYFDEVGECNSLTEDERQNRRVKVRSQGVMLNERSLPSCDRGTDPIGIYSRDFSRRGCGFIAPHQLFPQEAVRLILPTFWMRLLITRTRRVGPSCYEVGGELIVQHVPSEEAFAGLSLDPCAAA